MSICTISRVDVYIDVRKIWVRTVFADVFLHIDVYERTWMSQEVSKWLVSGL